MELTKENVKSILSKRIVVTVGKHTVKVTGVKLNHMRDDNTMVNIVNFAGCTPYQLGIAKDAYKAGKYDEAVGKGTSISTSLLPNQYCPVKGEIVDIEVGETVNKDGDTILVVTSVIKRQAEKSSTINVDDWDTVETAVPAKPNKAKEEELA